MFQKLMPFFRSKPPEFNTLESYEHKDQYFFRVARWHWLDEHRIVIADPHAPRMITCDDWPQVIFLAANGTLTVAAYVAYVASKYSGEAPKRLAETVIHNLNQLKELALIDFAPHPTELDAAHVGPESPVP
jgi:hypothetical protein